MLPSTGHFTNISCPFYDSGLCERPYCHFRHSKKDSQESNSAVAGTETSDNEDILQKLVSAAVKKVLQNADINPSALSISSAGQYEGVSQIAVDKIVEGLIPALEPEPPPIKTYVPSTQVSYKPTPISELRKRHIPIPYSPSLVKPTKVIQKRSATESYLPKRPRQELKRHLELRQEVASVSGTPVSSSSSSPADDTEAKFSSDEFETSHEIAAAEKGSRKNWEKESGLYDSTTEEPTRCDTYIPTGSASNTKFQYKPSDIAVPEPSYVPQTNSSSVSSSYKPSTVSHSEPEYTPKASYQNASEYHPTSKKELVDLAADVNLDVFAEELSLLEEILDNDLKDELDEIRINEDADKNKDEGSDVSKPVDGTDDYDRIDSKKESSLSLPTKSKHETLEAEKFKEKLSKSSSKRSLNSKLKDSANRNNCNDKRNVDKSKKSHGGETRCSESDKKSSNSKKSNEISREKGIRKEIHLKETTVKKSSEGREVIESQKSAGDKTSSEASGGEIKKEHKRRSHSRERSTHQKKHHHSRSNSKSSAQGAEKLKSNSSSSSHKTKTEKHRTNREVTDHKEKSVSRSDSSSEHSKGKCHSGNSKPAVSQKGRISSHQSSVKSSRTSMEIKKKDITKNTGTTKSSGQSIHEEAAYQDSSPNVNEAFDDGQFYASSSEEDDVTKECMRIFQEYEPRKVTCVPEVPVKNDTEALQDVPVPGKKRIAHDAAQTRYVPPVKLKPSVLNPGLKLAERYQKQRLALAEKNLSVSSASDSASTSDTSNSAQTVTSPPASRIRVASVQNVQLLLAAKKRMEALKSVEASDKIQTGHSTIAQTIRKGAARIAHVPSVDITEKHFIPAEVNGKVPAHIRQNYFNLLASEYVNLLHDEGEAHKKAIEDEQQFYESSSCRAVYTNILLKAVQSIRRKAAERAQEVPSKKLCMGGVQAAVHRTVSHAAMLAGSGRRRGTWSVEKARRLPGTPKYTYQNFLKYVLSLEDLKKNGFPRPHEKEKGVAVVYSGYKQGAILNDPLKRICDRCGKEYSVNSDGHPVKNEECVNHSGRLFNVRINGSWQERYNCCSEGIGSAGCNHSDCHVSSNFNPNNLRNFVKTLPEDMKPADGDYGVYALDCEMCYTTMGLELTRVTVIDREFKTKYETLVKPRNPVIDYNTRFSGITEEMLRNVTTTIVDVQCALLTFVNSKTILIGHSLESDFKALKLIHDTVVDTSIVFPHRRGLPYKRALKTLCSEYLSKTIQNCESGHDSAEDAKACMELMLWQIKQDA